MQLVEYVPESKKELGSSQTPALLIVGPLVGTDVGEHVTSSQRSSTISSAIILHIPPQDERSGGTSVPDIELEIISVRIVEPETFSMLPEPRDFVASLDDASSSSLAARDEEVRLLLLHVASSCSSRRTLQKLGT